ncbi:helix-turn-helix domain-containing protein [Bacteroides ovatus]|uniref:helix-turn-helix domain-containing protein n=1 Tax=Bacteroides ovatus TaxID=28116 RepID=UPI0020A6DB4E|nr:helix-turn-helix domain-containing protein [Bacteroides ovatus]CAG9867156.1 putative excisionase [Bacteroides ovatus]
MADTTLQDLSNKLDHIAELTLIGSKTVLNIEEAALFTGLSVGHIYRLTSGKKIPHFKKQRKLYFKKAELEAWMLDTKILTDGEVQSKASTYVATHK